MRKIFSLGLMLICTHVNIEAHQTAFDQLVNAQKALCKSESGDTIYCPVCPEGQKGKKGDKGRRGRRGDRGRTGRSLEINDYLEVTKTGVVFLDAGAYVSFSPPSFALNGIDLPNGLELIESVPGSGSFDQIRLPSEPVATFYAVTHGFCVGIESSGDFSLELNGTNLPYTNVAINASYPELLFSRTSVIVNPPNTIGRLKVLLQTNSVIRPPEDGLFSGYLTIVKLNNLGNNL